MHVIDFLKALLFGIVEGVTEWLPVSSTGHLILLEVFLPLEVSPGFYEMFQVLIQLGAIGAVVFLFFGRLNPLGKPPAQSRKTLLLWGKVLLAVLPSAVLGLIFDDWLDAHFYNYRVVALTLILYGFAFLFVEKLRRKALANSVDAIDWKTALCIGFFQCLSLIPGTSRSGATVLGALLFGVSRSAGAEFSFFLAIPTMLGAGGLKLFKFLAQGITASMGEWSILLVGCGVSFLVSMLVIQGLMEYVRKHSFAPFGIYRIALGLLVLGYFSVFGRM